MLYIKIYYNFYDFIVIICIFTVEFNITTYIMEKLTETINAIKVTKSTKKNLIKIAEIEEIQIQQVCRKFLNRSIKEYFIKDNDDNYKII
jgi:hypothetical protein